MYNSIYIMDDIKEYYPVFEEVIREKGLKNFWIICKNTEFKPIVMSKEKMREKVKKKAEQLKGLSIANITMLFYPLSYLDNPDPNKRIFIIHIYVYKINDKGEFDTGIKDTSKLSITYTKDELNNNHLTIDELKEMIRMVYKKKILTTLIGISHTSWQAQYNDVLKKEKLKELKKKSKSKRSKSKKSKT